MSEETKVDQITVEDAKKILGQQKSELLVYTELFKSRVDEALEKIGWKKDDKRYEFIHFFVVSNHMQGAFDLQTRKNKKKYAGMMIRVKVADPAGNPIEITIPV